MTNVKVEKTLGWWILKSFMEKFLAIFKDQHKVIWFLSFPPEVT